MRRLCWAFLVILCGLSFARCATRPGGAPRTSRDRTFTSWFRDDLIPVRRVLAASLDTVWAAIPEVFAYYGYPGGPSMVADEEVFLTPPLKIQRRLYKDEPNSDYLDCGRTPMGVHAADAYPVTFSMMARLSRRDSDSTMVEIFVGGTARDPLQETAEVSCTGTGRLETALLQRLEAQTRHPSARLEN